MEMMNEVCHAQVSLRMGLFYTYAYKRTNHRHNLTTYNLTKLWKCYPYVIFHVKH